VYDDVDELPTTQPTERVVDLTKRDREGAWSSLTKNSSTTRRRADTPPRRDEPAIENSSMVELVEHGRQNVPRITTRRLHLNHPTSTRVHPRDSDTVPPTGTEWERVEMRGEEGLTRPSRPERVKHHEATNETDLREQSTSLGLKSWRRKSWQVNDRRGDNHMKGPIVTTLMIRREDLDSPLWSASEIPRVAHRTHETTATSGELLEEDATGMDTRTAAEEETTTGIERYELRTYERKSLVDGQYSRIGREVGAGLGIQRRVTTKRMSPRLHEELPQRGRVGGDALSNKDIQHAGKPGGHEA
jgi:hypothetical protein